MDQFLQRATSIVSNCLLIPAQAISADDELERLGRLDSMAFELFAIEIESATGKSVDIDTLLSVRTVRDIVELLRSECPTYSVSS